MEQAQQKRRARWGTVPWEESEEVLEGVAKGKVYCYSFDGYETLPFESVKWNERSNYGFLSRGLKSARRGGIPMIGETNRTKTAIPYKPTVAGPSAQQSQSSI